MTEILRISEAARLAGICPATLRAAIKSDTGPEAVRVGKRWFGVHRQSLEDWIATRSVRAKALGKVA